MTLPTSRQRPWIFPDQREHMASRHHSVYEPTVHAPELMSSSDGWHRSKQESERERVLASLRDNHTKDRYYVSNPNKNWGENDLHRSRHKHRHPETLHGGVMTSKAGQQWGFNRLKERVNELNIRASAAFGTEANMAQPSKLPGKTGGEDAIETALTMLYDAMEAQEPSNLIQNAQKVLSAIYENGDSLGSSKIADYLSSVHDIKRDALELLGAQNIQGDERSMSQFRRVVRALLPMLDRCLRLLDLVAKTANLSQPERKQAVQSSKGRDLAEAKVRYGTEQIYPGTGPGGYDSTTGPGVPGSNPPGTTPFTAVQQGFQGQRNLDEPPAGPRNRYGMLDFEPDAGDASASWGDLGSHASSPAASSRGSTASSASAASPTSSALARGDRGPALMGLNAANLPASAPGTVGRGAGNFDGDIEWLKTNVDNPMTYKKAMGDWVFSQKVYDPMNRTTKALGSDSNHNKYAWVAMWANKNNPTLLTNNKYAPGAMNEQIITLAQQANFNANDKPGWNTPTGLKFWIENVKPELIKKAGGCGECDEGAGRRRHRRGGSPGEAPTESMGAKEAFKQSNGRYPKDNEELLAWMTKKNEQNPNHDHEESSELPPVDTSKAPPDTGKGKYSARHHARRGAGKPRDCEGSRLLKFLNDVEDSHHSSEGKKKNDSGRHR